MSATDDSAKHGQSEVRQGPGVRLLAAISGESPEAIATDRAALRRALGAVGREALALIRGSASDEPKAQEAARERWNELQALVNEARVEAEGRSTTRGLPPAQRARLHDVLGRAVASLEQLKRETVDAPEARAREDR